MVIIRVFEILEFLWDVEIIYTVELQGVEQFS